MISEPTVDPVEQSHVGVNDKIVITGAAGLVGQNLVVQLKEAGYKNLVAIDKHEYNLKILKQLHSEIEAVHADLAEPGHWENTFKGAACLIQLQAQITGKTSDLFIRNNLDSTRLVLAAAHRYHIPYLVHISSSVVNSVADDNYTNTKKEQERMVIESQLRYCILRPTLMFGWFDPKHLGWLSRFMERTPVFPIPGHGRYMRQPLYNKDFCKVIVKCMQTRPDNRIFDIVGQEKIDYIDIIRTIKHVKNLKTLIVHIPYMFFYWLLKFYALFSRNPPFTADQLKALTAGDEFTGVDMEKVFSIKPTPFINAIQESYLDGKYGGIVLKR